MMLVDPLSGYISGTTIAAMGEAFHLMFARPMVPS
jgi:hypothetical protein